jgi:hypothetical protein
MWLWSGSFRHKPAFTGRSPVSVEFTPDGDGTRLVLTEHGAYLDGLDQPSWREAGTKQQLAALAKEFTA